MSASAPIVIHIDGAQIAEVLRDKILRRSRKTSDGCWFWEGATTSDGRYGRCNVRDVTLDIALLEA